MKWKSVFLLLVLVVIVGFLLYMISQNIAPGFTVKNDLGVRVSASPSTFQVGDSDGSEISIEVTNQEEDLDVEVTVEAETHDSNLVFGYPKKNSTKTSEQNVVIGPGEIKKVVFNVYAKRGAHEGKYRIDITAHKKNGLDKVEDDIYVYIKKED
ncbi:hypothetical protein ACFLRC_00890 [Candidatus Altiarchaeota archaeon]